MVEENGNGGQTQSSTPSKERILPKLVVKYADFVTINAANLDLDYAVKGMSYVNIIIPPNTKCWETILNILCCIFIISTEMLTSEW